MGEDGKSIDQELAELEAEERTRAEAEELEEKQQKVAYLKLTKQFEASHGKRGKDFTVVMVRKIGVFVVRKPTIVEYKTRMAKLEEENRHEDTHAFAREIVLHPDKMTFDGIASDHPGVANALEREGMTLAHLLEGARRKKS